MAETSLSRAILDALPMDEASRLVRAKGLGYANEPFYRGEASGKLQDEYTHGYFSREPEYAKGFAQKGGQAGPREFRLNLKNTFSDRAPITANRFAALVEAAAKSDPGLARDLAETVAPGKGVKWLVGFGEAQPDFVVVERGGAPLIRQAIERGSGDPVGIFRTAGYDAIDSGRDVRKLTGEGIRLKEAAFDPSKAKSRNIRAGIFWPVVAAGTSGMAAYSDAEAREAEPGERRRNALAAAGVAGGSTAGTQYGLTKIAPLMARSVLGRAILSAIPPAAGALSAWERGQQESQPGSWFTTSSGYMWPNIPLSSANRK
jgi:hypothetical protein